MKDDKTHRGLSHDSAVPIWSVEHCSVFSSLFWFSGQQLYSFSSVLSLSGSAQHGTGPAQHQTGDTQPQRQHSGAFCSVTAR